MKFSRIHTSTLLPTQPLQFDVFVKVGGKHILYIRKDDTIDMDRMDRLRAKRVKHLFIDADAEKSYQQFLDTSLNMLKNDKSMDKTEKSQALVGQSKAAVQSVFDEPEKKENFTRTQDLVAVQVQHMMKNPDALAEMLGVEAFDKSVYQHSVNVSTIAVGLANFLGAPEDICQVVGTGALLHDIGKTNLGFGATLTDADLSKEDKEKYKTHPRVGCEVLQGKKYISKDVLDIILLHEERLDGRGYPAGVKKLDQIFQVVGLANMYDKMVSFEGMSPQDAYQKISSMRPFPYEEDLIVGLRDVLAANKIY